MYKKLLLFMLMTFPVLTYSADIFLADRLYTEKKYKEAKEQYLLAAELGNPHAYYQLANIDYKGLAGEKDLLNALVYFYLAAEQKFHNSENIMEKILESIPEESQKAVLQALDEHKKSHGKQQKINKYFPIVDTEILDSKMTFDGEERLETVYHPDDVEIEDFYSDLNGDASFDDSGDEEDFDDSFALLISTPKTPFLIIDHDVYKDGSVRYSSEVQKFGLYASLLNEFVAYPLAKPEINGKPTEFASRSYLGAAAFDKFTLHHQDEKMYGNIIKQLRRFKSGETINDRFNLAMLMLNFPWIEQEENEAEEILLELANKGHSPAMYEYGFKLYREQRDIDVAIHWISEASKYGLVRAEYRLAKILQASPWVKNDEKKALFWYQSAMDKGDVSAKIRTIDILLTAKDESLRDLELAKSYLATLTDGQSKNPEFYYLTALTLRSGENRNIKETVENLKRAILRGQISNWDVSEWEDLLRTITSGTVFVSEES